MEVQFSPSSPLELWDEAASKVVLYQKEGSRVKVNLVVKLGRQSESLRLSAPEYPHGFHMAWLSHLEPAACCRTALVGQGDPAASSGESGVCTSENTGENEHQVAKGRSQCWEVGGGSAEESTSSCAITGTSGGLHSQQKPRGWGSLVWWWGTRILGCPHTAWLQVPSLPRTTCVTLDKLLSLFSPQFPCL